MSKYRREETSSEDSDSEEERRKKDIKERDSFASRLKAKDESKIRKIAMPAGSGAGELQENYLSILNVQNKIIIYLWTVKAFVEVNIYHNYYELLPAAEAAKRLKIVETDTKEHLVSKLRIDSRRKYLEKREGDKVAELEADILDDEYLFEEEM